MRQIVLLAAILALGGCEDRKIPDAKKAVLASLKDPDSARFRDVRVSLNRETICGEVNAKNSMGGYTGFERFMILYGAVHFDPATENNVLDDNATMDLKKAMFPWNALCRAA